MILFSSLFRDKTPLLVSPRLLCVATHSQSLDSKSKRLVSSIHGTGCLIAFAISTRWLARSSIASSRFMNSLKRCCGSSVLITKRRSLIQ
ncbi:hypothetical protein [Bufonid herpesvirus 1]|uniref:hypothetical protein n=1 Tax=Bufonid herpesvirus 1 TaxID=2282206 RepID=UPI000EB6E8BF|nr:hypothetical protein [Bufonid herpesvirus 1]AXF48625.1 hypothetical protein [Bufonid herpesvirus 1]